MKSKVVVLVLLPCAVVAALTAAHAATLEPQMRTLKSLTAEIGTWNLVDDLNLSPAQMQALLPAAREVRSEHEAIEAEQTRAVAEFDRAIRVLRQELLANSGVSDEAKAGVARAEAGWKELEKKSEERAPEWRRVVQQTLTPEQLQILADYRPGAALGRARRARVGAPGVLARAERLLVRARQATPEQLEQAPQRLRQMLPPGRPRIPAARFRELAGQMLDIVMEARAMSDADFEARKPELAQRLVDLLPQKGAPGARRGRQSTGVDLEKKIGHMLLTPALATVLEAKLAIAQPGAFKPPICYPEDLASLVADVRLLNLVNSLYLSPDQMKALSGIISRAEADRQAARPQTEAVLEDLIALATQVRDELAAGGVSAQTLERVRTEGARGVQEKRAHETRMAQYVAAAKGVLNENQICLVSEFIPCLIPIKNLTNPERIGQAQNTEGAERMLARARAAPEDRVAAMMPGAQARLEALLRHKRLPAAEIEARLAELPRVVADARAMSDAEFELKKTELVKRVAPPEPAPVQGAALDHRIAEYLLSANLLPIFEQRIGAQGVASR